MSETSLAQALNKSIRIDLTPITTFAKERLSKIVNPTFPTADGNPLVVRTFQPDSKGKLKLVHSSDKNEV